jgi:Cation transporting ATPase, C-terminus
VLAVVTIARAYTLLVRSALLALANHVCFVRRLKHVCLMRCIVTLTGYSPGQLVFAWQWGLLGGALAYDQADAAVTGSSVYFITLVLGQAGHLLSIRSKTPYYAAAITGTGIYSSLPRWSRFQLAVKRTRPLARVVAAWVGALVTALMITEVPALQNLCGTGHVPFMNWSYAVGWAVLCFTIAEVRKWLIYSYPNSCIGRTDW